MIPNTQLHINHRDAQSARDFFKNQLSYNKKSRWDMDELS